jgi:hypothetical protein
MIRARFINSIAILAIGLATACATGGAGNGGDDDDGSGTPDAGVNILPDSGGGGGDGGGGAPDAMQASCDLVAQTGCPAGKACDLGASNTPECRDVTAPGTETSTCNGDTTCAAGYICIGAPGSCMKFCSNDSQCGTPNDGSLCIINVIDENMQPIPGAVLCTQACDPVTSSGCPTGFGCHIYQESAGQMRILTACDPAGAGMQNATCTDNSSCAAGFDCFAVTSGGVTTNKCLHNCNATTNTGCAGTGGTCQGTGAVIGGNEYGGCL